jgi:hypothetical protein
MFLKGGHKSNIKKKKKLYSHKKEKKGQNCLTSNLRGLKLGGCEHWIGH